MFSRFGDDLFDISKRVLELTPLKNKTVKIAITGLSRAGKSVFITSFIDQLLNNKNIFLHVKNPKTFRAKLQAPNISMKRFDYYHYEKTIKKEHKWCDGTDSITSALIKIQTKGRIPLIGDEDFYIEIVDYPGEWILDLVLLNHTYSSWSKMCIQWLKSIDDEKVSLYLQKLQNLSTDETSEALEMSLHAMYVELIGYLKQKNYSFITPGRFLVPGDMKDDPILVFAPLLKGNSKIFKIFENRYKTYVKDIVRGIHLDYFRGFDRQIILFDIIKALQNGYECYEDMKRALDSIFGIYSHAKSNFISQILNPTIQSVAFVATKADLVPSTMHEDYLSLLKEISENMRHKLEEIDVKTYMHVTASIKCTQTVMGQKDGVKIACLRGIDNSQKVVEVYTGKMPSSFPSEKEWDSSLYMYEEFLPPKKEYKTNEPFEHIHLDRLIWDTIGDML